MANDVVLDLAADRRNDVRLFAAGAHGDIGVTFIDRTGEIVGGMVLSSDRAVAHTKTGGVHAGDLAAGGRLAEFTRAGTLTDAEALAGARVVAFERLGLATIDELVEAAKRIEASKAGEIVEGADVLAVVAVTVPSLAPSIRFLAVARLRAHRAAARVR